MRIAIVVLGLLSGLVARVAVDLYHHYRDKQMPTPAAATATPLQIKSQPAK